MARKPTMTLETLTALGAGKLAQLALDEAERNPAFRKLVKAAVAGQKGPEEVGKIVDRRLAALEKARSFIDWQKERAFRDDLAAIVAVMSSELGPAAPAMAIQRLLRFLATFNKVAERVDDSSGRVQNVYADACDSIGVLAPKLSPDETARLPEQIMAAVGDNDYGHLAAVANAVIPHLPDEILQRWDADLGKRQQAKAATPGDRSKVWSSTRLAEIRQLIARRLGNLDGLIAMEATKHPNLQDTVAIATLLLEAGRASEALEWVRRNSSRPAIYMSRANLADGRGAVADPVNERVVAEARILEALDQKDAAQALRWSAFEATFDPDMLRAYVAALPDFEEFDALDRAFAHALGSEHIYNALLFLHEWPRSDLAGQLVRAHAEAWDGEKFRLLGPIADALADTEAPAAATLYRAIISTALKQGNSHAYAQAARCLAKLDAMAANAPVAATSRLLQSHAGWRAGLLKQHQRKTSFWAHLKPKA